MPLNFINIYSTRNVGDAAILMALARMAPDGRAFGRVPDEAPLLVPGLTHVSQLSDGFPRVSVGGDIFNNARPYFVTRRFLANLMELRVDAPRTILFGQSIPRSCRSLGFLLLASTLKRMASVTVRDEESWRRLRLAGVQAHLSYDSAFGLDMPSQAALKGSRMLAAAGLDARKTVLLSLRGFDRMYPEDEGLFLRKMETLARALKDRGHACGVLIQADAVGSDSDRALAQRLHDSVGTTTVDIVSGNGGNPVEALQCVLAAANIVVAVRYHTAVLRMLAGRCAYVLSYSNKSRDLIDRLGAPGCDLSSFDPEASVRFAEASGDRAFDPGSASRSVRESFMRDLARTGHVLQ